MQLLCQATSAFFRDLRKQNKKFPIFIVATHVTSSTSGLDLLTNLSEELIDCSPTRRFRQTLKISDSNIYQ